MSGHDVLPWYPLRLREGIQRRRNSSPVPSCLLVSLSFCWTHGEEMTLLPTTEALSFLQTTTTLLCGQFGLSQLHGFLFLRRRLLQRNQWREVWGTLPSGRCNGNQPKMPFGCSFVYTPVRLSVLMAIVIIGSREDGRSRGANKSWIWSESPLRKTSWRAVEFHLLSVARVWKRMAYSQTESILCFMILSTFSLGQTKWDQKPPSEPLWIHCGNHRLMNHKTTEL